MGTVKMQSIVVRIIAALHVATSIPFCVPRMRGMLPTGMPNITMHTGINSLSDTMNFKAGNMSKGNISNLITEKIYSLGCPKILFKSVWAKEKPTATRAIGEVTFPR